MKQFTAAILAAVDAERTRQERLKAAGKFVYSCEDVELSDEKKMMILLEEVGEASHEINESFGGRAQRPRKLQNELIQCAAVCVAWAESLQKQIEPDGAKKLGELFQARADEAKSPDSVCEGISQERVDEILACGGGGYGAL